MPTADLPSVQMGRWIGYACLIVVNQIIPVLPSFVAVCAQVFNHHIAHPAQEFRIVLFMCTKELTEKATREAIAMKKSTNLIAQTC